MPLDKRQRRPLSPSTRTLLASLPHKTPKYVDKERSTIPSPPRRFQDARRRKSQLGVSKPLQPPFPGPKKVQRIFGDTPNKSNDEQPAENNCAGLEKVAMKVPLTPKKGPVKTYSKIRSIVASPKSSIERIPETPIFHDRFGIPHTEDDDSEGPQQRPLKKQCSSRRNHQSIKASKVGIEESGGRSEINPVQRNVVHLNTGSSQHKPRKSKASKKQKRPRRLPVDELIVVSERLPDSDPESETVRPNELSDDPILETSSGEQQISLSTRPRDRIQKATTEHRAGGFFGLIDISDFRLPKAGHVFSHGVQKLDVISPYRDGFEGAEAEPIGLLAPRSERKRRRSPRSPVTIGELTLVAEREFGEYVREGSANRRKRSRQVRFSSMSDSQYEIQQSSSAIQAPADERERRALEDPEQTTPHRSHVNVESRVLRNENASQKVYSQRQSQSIPKDSANSTSRDNRRKVPLQLMMVSVPRPIEPTELDDTDEEKAATDSSTDTDDHSCSTRETEDDDSDEGGESCQEIRDRNTPEGDNGHVKGVSPQLAVCEAKMAGSNAKPPHLAGPQEIVSASSRPCKQLPNKEGEVGLSQKNQPPSTDPCPTHISAKADITKIEQPVRLGEHPPVEGAVHNLQHIATQAIDILEADDDAGLDTLGRWHQEEEWESCASHQRDNSMKVDDTPLEIPSSQSPRNGTPVTRHRLSSRCPSKIPSLLVPRSPSPELGMEVSTACHTQASIELGGSQNSDTSHEISETQFEDEPAILEPQQEYAINSSTYFTCPSEDLTGDLLPLPISRSLSSPAKFTSISLESENAEKNTMSSVTSKDTFRPRNIIGRRATGLEKASTGQMVSKLQTRNPDLRVDKLSSGEPRRMMTLPFAPPFKKPIGGSQSAREVWNGISTFC